MQNEASDPADGRRLRRERNRTAVIDAVFELIRDGKVPPSVEQVAERAGVSVSSIYRNFDGLDDMRQQAFDRFEHRYAHLLDGPVDDGADQAGRITDFVGSRVRLYGTAGALMAVARQRALDYEPMAHGVARSRMRLAGQAQRCFAPELGAMTPGAAADLVAMVDVSTSPEAFEVLRAVHSRSDRQITDLWTRTLSALVADWQDETMIDEGDPT